MKVETEVSVGANISIFGGAKFRIWAIVFEDDSERGSLIKISASEKMGSEKVETFLGYMKREELVRLGRSL